MKYRRCSDTISMINSNFTLPPLMTKSSTSEESLEAAEKMYTLSDFKKTYKTQQVYGSPAASLSWGIEGAAQGQIDSGIEGEKQVAGILDQFVKSNPSAKVFHSVEWPGSKGDTDHMLIVGDLVIIIDAKRWKSKRKYSVTAKGAILRGTVPFPEGKVKMIPAMKAWNQILPKEAKVVGVVCIAQHEVFVPYDRNWHTAPYRLVTAEKLVEYLEGYLDKQNKHTSKMNPKLLSMVALRVIKPRSRRAEIIKLDAMKR